MNHDFHYQLNFLQCGFENVFTEPEQALDSPLYFASSRQFELFYIFSSILIYWHTVNEYVRENSDEYAHRLMIHSLGHCNLRLC
jgi:hypothetical protein